MKCMLAIWGRELRSMFVSPIAYVTVILFHLLATGTFVISLLQEAGSTTLAKPVTVALLEIVVIWMIFLVTVVSMRLFSEELRVGTFETLFTAPVSDGAVVLGKYAGGLSFVLLVLMPVLAAPYLVAATDGGNVRPDSGEFAATCLAAGLIAALFVAIGLLASLVTANQIVSALLAFGAIWGFGLSGWVIESLAQRPSAVSELLSLEDQIRAFANGIVDTRPVVLWLSMTVGLLFLAVRLLEARRWRV